MGQTSPWLLNEATGNARGDRGTEANVNEWFQAHEAYIAVAVVAFYVGMVAEMIRERGAR